MPVWKILFILFLGGICLALALATVVVPLSMVGAPKWQWMGGLGAAALVMGTLFALFLRHADGAFEDKPGWARR